MTSEIVHLGGGTIGITPFLLFYLVSTKLKRKSVAGVETGVAMLALMLAGYFVVCLTTPVKLAFHLQTSLSRLLLQLWPSAVFVFFTVQAAVPGTIQLRDSPDASEP